MEDQGELGRTDMNDNGMNDNSHNSGGSASRTLHKRMESLKLVDSKQSVKTLRSEGKISGGASKELAKIHRQKLLSREVSSRFSLTKYTSSDDEEPDDDELEARPKTKKKKPTLSYIAALIEDLLWALRALGCTSVETPVVEGWAIFVHHTLTRDSRAYHGMAHVFSICAGASPIQLLSAVVRDLVNHYVDRDDDQDDGMQQEGLLAGVLTADKRLASDLKDPSDLVVCAIFNHSLGSDMQAYHGMFKGLDVFLSAMLASRMFQTCLDLRLTARMAVCLEATIPFRKCSATDNPLERLYERFVAVNEKFSLGFTEQEMIETVQEGADLHNRSVGNMVSEDLAEFLDHTWSLLPEHHAPLRRHALYTLSDYYTAIQSMVRMLQGIDPESVYISFRGLPADKEMTKFQTQLSRNLEFSVLYMQIRLFSVMVVSAFAALTGGDAPKAFFFGDLPTLSQDSSRLGDGLPPAVVPSWWTPSSSDTEVLDVLKGERMAETGFDTRNAPLAAFLFETLGPDTILASLKQYGTTESGDWGQDSQAARSFLAFLPQDVVATVGREVGRITISRAPAIERLLGELHAT